MKRETDLCRNVVSDSCVSGRPAKNGLSMRSRCTDSALPPSVLLSGCSLGWGEEAPHTGDAGNALGHRTARPGSSNRSHVAAVGHPKASIFDDQGLGVFVHFFKVLNTKMCFSIFSFHNGLKELQQDSGARRYGCEGRCVCAPVFGWKHTKAKADVPRRWCSKGSFLTVKSISCNMQRRGQSFVLKH